MKILLISGHGAGDSGAVGCGHKEADLTRTATNILAGKLALDAPRLLPGSSDWMRPGRLASLIRYLNDIAFCDIK